MSTSYPAPTNFRRPMIAAFIIGLLAVAASVAGLLLYGPGQFFQAYLYSFLFWLGISLGSLGLLMLHFLTSSRWGLTVRRILEAASGTLWLMGLLFIPLVFGLPFLFPWARPAEVAANEHMAYQTWYLNPTFFVARAVIYFVIWIALALIANRAVTRMGQTATADQRINPVLHGRLQGLGAVGSILYVFSMFFASVDWVMSLQPSWISTAIGFILVITQAMGALAFAILMLNLFPGLSLGWGRRWNYDMTPVPYRDLGALTLTFVMAWSYVSYFQMLIQWSANIPREVVWYIARTAGGWSIVAWLIAILAFFVPFLMLLTIRVRHNLRALGGISLMLLVANLIIYFWHIKPSFYPTGFAISLIDIAMPVAMGGIWLAAFLFALSRRPALSTADQTALNLSSVTVEERAVS